MTIREYRHQFPNATAAEIVAMRAAEPPVAKASSIGGTYATYLSIGQMLGNNVAADMSDRLQEWVASGDLRNLNPALPSPTALRLMHERLTGYPGVDMSSADAPGMMALFSGTPNLGRTLILTAEQAAALLAVGYTFPTPITEADVAADIAAELAEIEAEQFAVQKRALGEQISADWNLRSNTLDAATSLADLPTLEQLRAVTA